MGIKHCEAIIQLQQIPELNKQGILSIKASDKGLINYNFTVKTLLGTIHARINKPDVLGVCRKQEAMVLNRIKPLDLAPKILVNNLQDNYLITQFVDVPTWDKSDCYKYQQLLLEQLKKVHAIDMSQQLPSFLSRLEQYEQYSLDQFDASFVDQYQQTKQQLILLGFFDTKHLLHYDLNGTNLLGTKKLTIIDWEFAGCGHPIFDLAIFIQANKLEILKCQAVVDYCYAFENGVEIFKLSIKLASDMIKLWEVNA